MFTQRQSRFGALFQAGLVLALVLGGVFMSPASPAAAAGAANDHTVLILDTTVSGGAGSTEGAAAAAIGMTVEVVDAAGWAAKTTADFATYRALILGDRRCSGVSSAAAAVANNTVWGPAVTGRIIIMGSDPVYHASQGGSVFTTGAVQFVSGEAAKTGAYISLSCYYSGGPEHQAVPLLNAFGTFTVRGVGCYNVAHIVASSPALTGSTDVTLSDWSCSVHEAFDLFPAASFDVLAIARGIGDTFTASDGTIGTPYILARGVSVISDITLTPTSGTAAPGSPYTLTATVKEGGTPTPGRTVTFTAIGGPNNGLTLTGAGPTNASGQTTATYTSTMIGTDTWVARFMDSTERTQTSGRATVEWGGKSAVPTVAPRLAAIKASSPSCGQVTATATLLTPGLAYRIIVTPSAGGTLYATDVTADAAGTATVTIDLAKAFGTSGGTFNAYVLLSIGIRYSNIAGVTATACPVATPTPAPTATPTPAPVGNLPSTIGRLPSTSTTDSVAFEALAIGLGLLALTVIAWRKRPTKI